MLEKWTTGEDKNQSHCYANLRLKHTLLKVHSKNTTSEARQTLYRGATNTHDLTGCKQAGYTHLAPSWNKHLGSPWRKQTALLRHTPQSSLQQDPLRLTQLLPFLPLLWTAPPTTPHPTPTHIDMCFNINKS